MKDKNFDPKEQDQKDVIEGSITSDVRDETAFESSGVSKKPAARSGPLSPQLKDDKDKVVDKLSAVSTALSPSGVSPASNGGIAVMSVTFSGGDSSVVGQRSSTVVGSGNQRRDTRTLRRDETVIRAIDDVVSPQTYLDEEGASEPTSAEGHVQGGITRKLPPRMHIGKRRGGIPIQREYNASLDLITRDEIIYSTGMNLQDRYNPIADQKPVNPVKEMENILGSWEEVDIPSERIQSTRRGNFIARELAVTFPKGGGTPTFAWIEDEIHSQLCEPEVVNRSAPHLYTHANMIELTRQEMYAKTGNPMSENFSPLSAAIPSPNGALSVFHDLEIMTGTEVATSFRSLSHALSYQINKSAKDGLTPATALNDMATDHCDPLLHHQGTHPFAAGSPENHRDRCNNLNTVLVNAYDTIRKYTTRGDMLTLRKGYRQFIDAAERHIGVFRMDRDYMSSLNDATVFSTINLDYDEQMPVYATGYYTAAHPRSFNIQDTNIRFENAFQTIAVSMGFPLVKGIERYIKKNASKIFDVLDRKKDEGSGSNVVWRIPIVHSFTTIGLWDQLVCAAAGDIAFERQEAFRLYLDYEKVEGPIFKTMVPVDANAVTTATQYVFKDYVTPLTVGRMSQKEANKWTFPEIWVPHGRDDRILNSNDAYSVYAPWYVNEHTVRNVSSEQSYDVDELMINYPLMRTSRTHQNMQNLLSMDERDLRLSYDMITDLPRANIDGLSSSSYSEYVDGNVVISFGKGYTPTVKDILDLPRELGYRQVSPAGYLQPEWIMTENQGRYSATLASSMIGQTSYNAYIWYGPEPDNPRADSDLVAPSRYRQVREAIPGRRMGLNTASSTDMAGRIVLSHAALYTASGIKTDIGAEQAAGRFKPTREVKNRPSNLSSVNLPTPYVINFNAADFWVDNIMEFMLNPFDVGAVTDDILSDNKNSVHDFYDKLYKSGFIGFLPSDFTEDAINRERAADIAGISYVEDYYRDSVK